MGLLTRKQARQFLKDNNPQPANHIFWGQDCKAYNYGGWVVSAKIVRVSCGRFTGLS